MTTTTAPTLALAAGRWHTRTVGRATANEAIVVPLANGRTVRIDSLDTDMHLHVRPADATGYPTQWGVELHIPDASLVGAAIDAVIAYTKTLEEV